MVKIVNFLRSLIKQSKQDTIIYTPYIPLQITRICLYCSASYNPEKEQHKCKNV